MKILDTTLRDGSYVVDFGFTATQTTQIAAELDAAGVDLIEVGHGVGLNASEAGQGRAAETDVAYMRAAADAVTRAKWGMFAIPGICQLFHLDAAIDHGIGFLRFGVSIDAYKQGFAFVEKARTAGILTCVNFMKSHTREPIVFEQAARQAVAAGADYVYVVDSAGNMKPSRVRQYCERIADLPVGFHGHNNLGLANANALTALESGAQVIDCSLQGMGRSTGNTITEHFVGLLQQDGQRSDIDLFRLMDASEQQVRPLLKQIGHDSVDLICGYAGFHSSYMDVIRRNSLEYDIDPRRLILAVCEEVQSEAPEDLVRAKARQLKADQGGGGFKHRFPLGQYLGHEQDEL